ncbi:MAG: NAD(P)/FAD-dependent oxidoreductase [Peptococcaceae bacterium]|jgi:predicted Rossmann fold flavoprotein|nr:NAD(P)/FAD-dependent oxidoreductase [Peptococcaceae bacterium]MDH7524318.1 NAD(P)/FAD-dependent oxidoreductase [Peptococcaceae bacterium]
MNNQPVVVIGGGAAGMMAAGRAGELGARVILLEKNRVLGRKIGISGKGRCNVTNSGELRDFIENYPCNGQFLYSSLNRFSNVNLMQFLEKRGIPLKKERGGRVFPASDRAADIVAGLSRYLAENGVDVRLGERVLEIMAANGAVRGIRTAQEAISAYQVIVATGGKSYPATGSTGDGYDWAARLGHTIVPLRPALVPLNIREEWVKELQGLTLKNVEASVLEEEKALAGEFGEMLFTHFGVSGPIIMTLSRKVVERAAAPGKLKLKINLKPALSKEELDRRLARDFQKYRKKQLKNALDDLLPKRLIPRIIEASGINPGKFVNQLTREERRRLLDVLTGFTLTIAGPRSLSEAIVTAGGVLLTEINPKTMESRLVKGLYFAGEILDIDGYTGGYNLQAAFSTGYAAGEAAAEAALSSGKR